MKKTFILNLIAIAAMTLSAEARTIRLTGNGTGGTTVGDKEAACDRAYGRAEDDAENQCFRRDGEVMGSTPGSCHCRKKPGSHDDYTCEASVRLSCDVECRPTQVTLQAEGLGIDYSKNIACEDAYRRAESDTSYQCSRRNGFLVSSDELSCNCRRLNNGDYECRSTVRSQCELNECR